MFLVFSQIITIYQDVVDISSTKDVQVWAQGIIYKVLE